MSDLIGLDKAFQLVPLISILAAAVFFYARGHYHNDMARLKDEKVGETPRNAALESHA
ncbi:hypothetical protein D3C76_1528660 [compost metagenome]